MHCLDVDAQVNHEILDHFENCWTAFILCNRKYCTTAQGKLYAVRHVRRADFSKTVFQRKSYRKWQGNRVFVGPLLH